MNIDHKVLDAMGRAMGRFSMLQAGDRVAVGVSGGKDSLTLLHALVAYKKRAPFPYDVIAVTLDQGKFKLPILALEEKIRALGVEWVVREDPATLRLIAEQVAHGCDVCSRHRRYHLYNIVSELGCSVLALGHTADDCAESLMRNILFNGRIASLPPAHGFLPIACVCSEKENVRREIREFLDTMKSRHVGISDSITAALGNVNLYTLFGESATAEVCMPSEF
jgi:tRNA 2-thiocytidine biosynthesis protein TtcA